MSFTSSTKEVGDWQLQVTLGQGGFGTVTLWKKKDSQECVALKQCRVLLDEKNRKRWNTEIDIMKRLRHPHIVQARDVPPEFKVGQGELPLLGMEYCKRGDLRKVLCRPENCCGLVQDQVLDIAKHTCNGVEYLHSQRIIHRDLKPENIVIQEDEYGKTVYKLIDLGYAKDLDQGSVASTFVGTLQYLAPELFASQKYNTTVDYWTLGTVLFECITGTRPFLPHMPPVQWHGTVKGKKNTEICAYLNAQGEPVCTEKLLTPNHLIKLYQNCFETLLRHMLMFDPEHRGGGVDEKTRRPSCFVFLDKMISMQVINILCMNSDTLHSYGMRDTDNMSMLQNQLERDTGIRTEEQDLLLPTGQPCDPDNLARQCVKDVDKPDFTIFLFKKGCAPESLPVKPKPDLVNMILQEPTTLLYFKERKKSWGQGVFFCSQQRKEASRLLEGSKAAMLNLMRCNGHLTNLHKDMMGKMFKMEARRESFISSLNFDIESYVAQSSSGITSEKMFRNWRQSEKEIIEDFESLKKVFTLNGQVNITQTKINELQRSPFYRLKQVDGLVEVEVAAQKLYRELQQSKKTEGEFTFQDSTKMHGLIIKSINFRDKQTKDLYGYLRKLLLCKAEAEKLVPLIKSTIEEMTVLESQILTQQQQRQKDVWTLLKYAVNRVHNSGQPPVSMGQSYSRQSSSASGAGSSPGLSPGVGGLLSLSSQGHQSLSDSLSLLNQSSMAKSRFDDVFGSIKSEQGELLKMTELQEWQFLSNPDIK